MIEYRGFTKRFGDVLAANAINLTVPFGESVALIGPNGSGKTTTLKALLGLIRPTAGQVLVDGIDVVTGGAEIRARIGYLPQRLSFPEGASALETLRLYARLRRVPASTLPELLERVGLADVADRVVDGFSGGMRQRLGLAIALLGDPHTLVLDEPSAALDPSGALMVRDLIRSIHAEGRTVLLCSHDLAEVAALAKRLAIFVQGRVCAAGTLEDLGRNVIGGHDVEGIYRCYVSSALRSAA